MRARLVKLDELPQLDVAKALSRRFAVTTERTLAEVRTWPPSLPIFGLLTPKKLPEDWPP